MENTPYSVYAYNDETSWDRSIKICSNFDCGESFGISEIIIDSKEIDLKNLYIKTNEFTTRLTINTETKIKISHYGYSGIVTINECNRYFEYGIVGKIDISSGNLTVESNSTVFQINRLDVKNTKVLYMENSTIYNSYGLTSIKKTSGMYFDSLKEQLPFNEYTCTHDLYEDINNLVKGNYVICKKCGNTLIQVEDEEKKVTYNSVYGYNNNNLKPYIIETGTYKYDELPIDNCNVWPLNKILSCKHNYVLENCVREVAYGNNNICDSLVTDYFKCSRCEKEIVKEHQTGHLLNSDQSHCSREEYGCTYNLEHEGYTNIININNSAYVIKTDELYSKPSIIQENNSYYLCFSKGLESSNDSINVYRLTFKENTIYVYAEIVKGETPDNIETIKSIKIKNYNGATNGTNNVSINSETKVVVIYK